MEIDCLNTEQDFTPDLQAEVENTARQLLEANWSSVERLAATLQERGQLEAPKVVRLRREQRSSPAEAASADVLVAFLCD
jgi:hypothetical protein